MSQQNVVFKVSSSSGFRRFSLSSGSFSFEELQQRLASIAACPSYAVSYIDDDGDEVAIGSDSELLEAVRVMQIASPAANPLVIRLKLSLMDEPVSVLRPSDRRLSLSSDGSSQVHQYSSLLALASSCFERSAVTRVWCRTKAFTLSSMNDPSRNRQL